MKRTVLACSIIAVTMCVLGFYISKQFLSLSKSGPGPLDVGGRDVDLASQTLAASDSAAVVRDEARVEARVAVGIESGSLERAGVVGVVVDENNGDAVPNAVVRAVECQPTLGSALKLQMGSGKRLVCESDTDENGEFFLPVPLKSRVVLTVEKSGFGAKRISNVFHGERVMIRLSRARLISGRIVGSDGGPVPEQLMVHVYRNQLWPGEPVASQACDQQGQFECEVEPGQFFMIAYSLNYPPYVITGFDVTVEDSIYKTYRLAPGVIVRGAVESDDGVRIAGALVAVADKSWPVQETTESGEFSFTVDSSDDLVIQASASGYGSSETRTGVVGEGMADVVIKLSGGVAVTGCAEEVDGSPVVGSVIIVSGGAKGGERLRYRARSIIYQRLEKDGCFHVPTVRVDVPSTVVVVSDFGHRQTVQLPTQLPSSRVDLGRITLFGRSTVSGVVVDESNNPLSGVGVSLHIVTHLTSRSSTQVEVTSPGLVLEAAEVHQTTDSSGAFTFVGVEGGSVQIVIEDRRYSPFSLSVNSSEVLDVGRIGPRSTEKFTTGRVLGVNRRALAGRLIVRVHSVNGSRQGDIQSDGTFILNGSLVGSDVTRAEVAQDGYLAYEIVNCDFSWTPSGELNLYCPSIERAWIDRRGGCQAVAVESTLPGEKVPVYRAALTFDETGRSTVLVILGAIATIRDMGGQVEMWNGVLLPDAIVTVECSAD